MSLKEGVNIELQQQQDISFMSFNLAGCVVRFKLDVDHYNIRVHWYWWGM
jgi:hypothetical protein